jgi:hypothetical protein
MGRMEESKDGKKEECGEEMMEEWKECRRKKGSKREQRSK